VLIKRSHAYFNNIKKYFTIIISSLFYIPGGVTGGGGGRGGGGGGALNSSAFAPKGLASVSSPDVVELEDSFPLVILQENGEREKKLRTKCMLCDSLFSSSYVASN
jgi:hypothetical protein